MEWMSLQFKTNLADLTLPMGTREKRTCSTILDNHLRLHSTFQILTALSRVYHKKIGTRWKFWSSLRTMAMTGASKWISLTTSSVLSGRDTTLIASSWSRMHQAIVNGIKLRDFGRSLLSDTKVWPYLISQRVPFLWFGSLFGPYFIKVWVTDWQGSNPLNETELTRKNLPPKNGRKNLNKDFTNTGRGGGSPFCESFS